MMKLWSTSASVESTVPKFMTNVSDADKFYVTKYIKDLNIKIPFRHVLKT